MIDTHCHLYDEKYGNEIDKIIDNFNALGGESMICDASSIETSKQARALAKKYSNVYYTVGVHPDSCDDYNEIELEELLKEKDEKLVAIGEIGLDYHFVKDNKEKQKNVFISQIKLAKKYKLPIVIHCRDSYGDMLEILKMFAPFEYGAVMHCFSGSVEFARELLRLGVKMSFTGTVTFKNSHVQNLLPMLPIESFFLETDSPYLAPTPLRGSRNEPKNVRLIYDFVAQLRDENVAEFEKKVDNNARKFYKIR